MVLTAPSHQWNNNETATEAVAVYHQATIGTKVSQMDSVVLHHARIDESTWMLISHLLM
jgi:hypothetical protein